MKDYMSVKEYIVTILVRSAWSLLICVMAVTGMSVTGTNDLQNKVFQFVYFFFVFVVELGVSIVYFVIFCKQRKQIDLETLNRKDMIFSCLIMFARLGWNISLALFIIVKINKEELMKVDRNYTDIYNLSIIIIVFTIVHILAFIVGVIYQPQDYIKEPEFKNVLDDIKYEIELEDQASQRKQRRTIPLEDDSPNSDNVLSVRLEFKRQLTNEFSVIEDLKLAATGKSDEVTFRNNDSFTQIRV